MNTNLKRMLDKEMKNISCDCEKCPIQKEDCLRIYDIINTNEGPYYVESHCLLKILMRDTFVFFHM